MNKQSIIDQLSSIISDFSNRIPVAQYINSKSTEYKDVEIKQLTEQLTKLKDLLGTNALYQEIISKIGCSTTVSKENAKIIKEQLLKLKSDIEVKRILVIGNGFDLAHGFPTRYCDFLDFCLKVKLLFSNNSSKHDGKWANELINKWEFNDTIKQLLYNTFIRSVDSYKKYINEIIELIDSNIWYQYFHVLFMESSLKNKTWIDFESEIAKQVKAVESYVDEYLGQKKDTIEKPKLLSSYTKAVSDPLSIDDINTFISDMYIDLNRLTRALEIYLSVFIQAVRIKNKVSDIEPYKYDYVLSFNYTDTFERYYLDIMYCDSIICYPHGKADKSHSISNCNLVLGIDEYLPEDLRDEKLTFLQFKKFYQRIFKETDKHHSKWIDSIRSSKTNKYEVHFFGHSLDITDKDILTALIQNENVQTKVFYYVAYEDDKSDLSTKIHNLVKVLGQKDLIERTSGGEKNTIVFIPQKFTL